MTINVAVLYQTDMDGHAAGGIDSYVRGILKHAPSDLRITLIGAADVLSRHALGREMPVQRGFGAAYWMPLVHLDPDGVRRTMPLTARYTAALLCAICAGKLRKFDVLDFHRMEPALLFRWDRRPKRLVMHQDLSGVIHSHSEIRWQHAPWVYRQLERLVLPTFTRLSAVRRPSRDAYATSFPRLAGRIELTPTFFDSEVFFCIDEVQRLQLRTEIRARLGLAGTTRLLVYAGRLDEAKNPRLLIEALAEPSLRAGDLHLALIGDGQLRPELALLVERLSLQGRVTMLGSQPKKTIQTMLQAGDLFVLSSAYEGMPIAVLEALACGLPVLSTDVGELRNVITDNENGLLCKGRSAAEFAGCIRAALSRADTMRGRACASSVQQFRAEVVLEETYRSYRRLAAQPWMGQPSSILPRRS
jgi:glycosyltransferase involved in cell wall biosynthesis